MVLRRIVNSTIVGGILGASLSNHMAQEHWRTKDMMSERDAMGLPYFRQRLATDWPMTQQDIDRWDAMGRNYVKNETVKGGAMGALLAGAGTYFLKGQGSRRRDPLPPYMPHPRVPGLGIAGAMAAPAA